MQDFDATLYRHSIQLATIAEVHASLGTRSGSATARTAWAGAGALLEVLARDLPEEQLVTRGTLGLAALHHYGQAGLGGHAQRLAVRLLQTELEPAHRKAIARLRGSRPVEAFLPMRESGAWSVAA